MGLFDPTSVLLDFQWIANSGVVGVDPKQPPLEYVMSALPEGSWTTLPEDTKGRCVGGRKAYVFEKLVLEKVGYSERNCCPAFLIYTVSPIIPHNTP